MFHLLPFPRPSRFPLSSINPCTFFPNSQFPLHFSNFRVLPWIPIHNSSPKRKNPTHMHRVNMSSDALMEKPNSVKYRCRRQSWYIILLSFLLWFGLFYLYSNIMVGDNDESNFVHDVVENEHDSEEGNKIRDVEMVGELNSGNETEIGRRNHSDRSLLPSEIDDIEQIMELVRELEAENRTIVSQENVDPPPVVEEREKIVRKPPVRSTRKETPRQQNRRQKVDPAPVVQRKRENAAKIDPAQARAQVKARAASCAGRYIYIHTLPKKFNQDLLDNCRSLSEWTDYCQLASNNGLGPNLPDYDKVYSRSGWFGTSQFFLEVIFHNRMKQYKCLTKDASQASAIFVPYYAGLDVQRYLWDSDGFMRGYDALNLVKWLASRPEWKRMWGGDHFLAAGRINWDFRRDPKNVSDWGNELLNLPETRNMTNLVIESSPWNYNDFAIPYPTYFHPSSDGEVFEWQNKIRRLRRKFLFSFAGGPRPNLPESIRNDIIDQCKASRRKCKYFECETENNKCDKPVYVMKIMQNSVFCLQPPGDSYTRKSVFDSILAGCIPVFFHPGTAYVQYIWHLPEDYTKYSVFILGSDIKAGKASIERTLQRIPREKRAAMREEVIKLIPNVIYANPTSRLETLEDAFDLTVKGVLERVEIVKKQMKEGKYLNSDFLEDDSWKYFTYGTVEPHEWDSIFANREM